MRLFEKTLIIVSATTISLVIILYAVSLVILEESATELEGRMIDRNVQRLHNGLGRELAELETLLFDWAVWDDTYAFIEDANEEYIKSNLVTSTFLDLRVNIMLFFDTSGELVFGKAFDLEEEEGVPIPESMKEHLEPDSLLLRHSDVESRITGVLLLPEAPMLVASQPILPSGRDGPIRGTMVIGRYLSSEYIERLGEMTNLPITAYRFDDSGLPSDFQIARASLSEQAPIFTRPLDGEYIAGYRLENDIYGNPALILRVDLPREIYRQSLASILYVEYSLVVAATVYGTAMILLLRNAVLSRLARLSTEVNSVASGGDLSRRVSVTGRDELTNLSDTINGMLAQLQSLQEMRSKLISSAAHDLRTPVVSAKGYIDWILSGRAGEVARPIRDLLVVVQRNINRLSGLTDVILDAYRIQSGRFQLDRKEVNLLEVARECVEEMNPIVTEKRQSLILDAPDHLPPIFIDKNRLSQVFINLLSNASKFTPEGGRINVYIEGLGDMVQVRVSDTGEGIREGDLSKIFEPFAQIGRPSHYKGTGLGLSIAKAIVEAHGGRIWAESEGEGKGATFTFTLPKDRSG